jgi:hypothetical protein
VPVEIEWFEEMLGQVRGERDSNPLDRATARGREMPLDELVAYAVEFIDSTA